MTYEDAGGFSRIDVTLGNDIYTEIEKRNHMALTESNDAGKWDESDE